MKHTKCTKNIVKQLCNYKYIMKIFKTSIDKMLLWNTVPTAETVKHRAPNGEKAKEAV